MVEIKGSVVSDAFYAVKKRSGDKIFNDIINGLDDKSKKIFGDMILATNWYPLDSFIKFLELDLTFTSEGNKTALISRSEELIESQLNGIYKSFVKFGSTNFVIDNCISLMHMGYFKGISIEKKIDELNKALIRYTGFEKQQGLIGYSIIGFYKKALELSGAKNIRTRYLTSIEDDKGYCDLEIVWD